MTETKKTAEIGSIREVLGIAIGEASMLWSGSPKGEFESERAVKILERLVKYVEDYGNAKLEEAAILVWEQAPNSYKNAMPQETANVWADKIRSLKTKAQA